MPPLSSITPSGIPQPLLECGEPSLPLSARPLIAVSGKPEHLGLDIRPKAKTLGFRQMAQKGR